MQDRESIANGLKILTKKYHVTQKELADIAGVSQATITHWIKKESDAGVKSREQLATLAEHFNEPDIFDRPKNEQEISKELFDSLLNDYSLYMEKVGGKKIPEEEKEFYQVLYPEQKSIIATMAFLSEVSASYLCDLENSRDNQQNTIEFFQKLQYFGAVAGQLYDFVSMHSINDLRDKANIYLFMLYHYETFVDELCPRLQSYQAEIGLGTMTISDKVSRESVERIKKWEDALKHIHP